MKRDPAAAPKPKSDTAAKPARTRVAIYTRQSVATDLEFGSIDAQRDAVEAYVASQRGEGWTALPARYDDCGFSGGNIERPAFQRLLVEVEAGGVDVIAAYKIDRISRSLADFTRFMETLERYGVGFVSTTQAFDTRTSMGRLTLNILASFSQFEREVISERTRDKMLATRRRGSWTGGRPILGYDIQDKALVVNTAEADTVRTIFRLYLAHGGLVSTAAELDRCGIRNKTWVNQTGEQVQGAPFTKSSLRNLLTNVLYLGKIGCGKELVEGRHEPIVDVALFDEVASVLAGRQRAVRRPGKWGAILSGLLRCARCGAAMTHTASPRGARTHRYYCCITLQKRGAAACPGSRAPAPAMEEVVLGHIRAIGSDPTVLLATVAAARRAAAQRPDGIAESRRLASERARLATERKNLLDALQQGGAAANAISGRLGEVDEMIHQLEARRAEIAAQLAARDDTIDEAALRHALEGFTPVWDEMLPGERARLLRLLVEEIRYDGQDGELEFVFRKVGIEALGREIDDRRSA